MSVRTRRVPINRTSTMECIQMEVRLTESNRVISMALPPGILPIDKLRQMGIDETFIVVSRGTTSMTY